MIKKLSALTAMLVMGLCAHAQNAVPACCKPVPKSNLELTRAFQLAHESPLPFNYAPVDGRMINFNTIDGKTASAYFVPAPKAVDQAIIIFHEWWGLNDYIKSMAESIQDSLGDVDVYAIDLYDGKVATTPEEAGKYMSSLTNERGDAIVNGLLSKIGKDKGIATMGWCLGGTWSYRASVMAGRQSTACVVYYGFPDRDARRLVPIKAPVQYHYGTQDNFIKPTDVAGLEKVVKEQGQAFTRFDYDAPHAFANPSNPNYNTQATLLAGQRAIAFLKEKMQLQ